MFNRIMRAALSAVFLMLFILPLNNAFAEVGVLIMHGKGGENKPKSPTKELASFLSDKGFIVESPDMPWHSRRIFDKTVEETFVEIDEIVAKLKARGADKIVVGGHSLGANAAIAYAANRTGLAGVFALAPGHIPEVWRDRFAGEVAKAKSMVEAGQGEETASFEDVNQGKETSYRMAAKNYLSWYDPDGQAVMPTNAASFKEPVAFLWVVGEEDNMSKGGEAYAYAKAPAHPNSQYHLIGGGHGATPKKAKKEVLMWLKGL